MDHSPISFCLYQQPHFPSTDIKSYSGNFLVESATTQCNLESFPQKYVPFAPQFQTTTSHLPFEIKLYCVIHQIYSSIKTDKITHKNILMKYT